MRGEGRAASRAAAALCLLLAAAPLAAGCGGGSGGGVGPSRQVPETLHAGESLYECLTRVVVQVAAHPRDLGLLREARKGGGVRQAGTATDPREGLEVGLLVPREGGAKRWVLWYLRPSGSGRELGEIVQVRSRWYDLPAGDPGRPDPGALERYDVMFKLRPTAADRQAFQRCVSFRVPAR